MRNVKKILYGIVCHYRHTRRVGHTYAALHGVLSNDNYKLVVPHVQTAKSLRVDQYKKIVLSDFQDGGGAWNAIRSRV